MGEDSCGAPARKFFFYNNNIGQMGGLVDNHTVEAKKGAPEKSVSDLRP